MKCVRSPKRSGNDETDKHVRPVWNLRWRTITSKGKERERDGVKDIERWGKERLEVRDTRQCPMHKHEMGLTQLPQDPQNANCMLARVQNGGDGHKFSNWKSFGC